MDDDPLTPFLIADPDRSNPTRNRWERPLDTIRSFEAAIDGNHTRRTYSRAGSSPVNVNQNISRDLLLTSSSHN